MEQIPPLNHVGIGQMQVARPPAKLTCLGLGSCVAVVLWDPTTKIGGMAHVMLPDQSYSPRKDENMPGKFGTTAVDALIDEMVRMGATDYQIVAKIAGGANMFKSISPNMRDIGGENVASVKKGLQENRIKIIAEEVGGSVGRTVELDTATGKLMVRTVKGGTKYI